MSKSRVGGEAVIPHLNRPRLRFSALCRAAENLTATAYGRMPAGFGRR